MNPVDPTDSPPQAGRTSICPTCFSSLVSSLISQAPHHLGPGLSRSPVIQIRRRYFCPVASVTGRRQLRNGPPSTLRRWSVLVASVMGGSNGLSSVYHISTDEVQVAPAPGCAAFDHQMEKMAIW